MFIFQKTKERGKNIQGLLAEMRKKVLLSASLAQSLK